jgi:hypothetical protein
MSSDHSTVNKMTAEKRPFGERAGDQRRVMAANIG